jgi:hypothetical protein
MAVKRSRAMATKDAGRRKRESRAIRIPGIVKARMDIVAVASCVLCRFPLWENPFFGKTARSLRVETVVVGSGIITRFFENIAKSRRVIARRGGISAF